MDRIREGRRGSSLGGSTSAPRRPRTTGLKDSSGMDDENIMGISHNSRIQEMTKKESSGVSAFVYSVNNLHSLRIKRRHQEASIHPCSTTRDGDEGSEETETGVSEDDDDLPPPMTRPVGKFKFRGKHANEGGTVDISAVPRKARTAMSKRPLESPSPPVLEKQPVPSSGTTSAVIQSVISPSRSGRRMKPCGPKSRPPKLTKVSVTPTFISEQEVEIAEALFDLARMTPSQTSPSLSESNADLMDEAKHEVNVVVSVSPIASTSVPVIPGRNHTGSPASPLPGTTYSAPVLGYSSCSIPAGSTCSVQVPASSHAEATKRKRPRVKRTDDAVSIHVHSCGPLSTNSACMFTDHTEENVRTVRSLEVEKVLEKTEASSAVSINNSTSSPHAIISVAVLSSPLLVQRPHNMESKASGTREIVSTKTENTGNALIEKVPGSPVLSEKKATFGQTNPSEEDNEAVGESSSFVNLPRSEEDKEAVDESSSFGNLQRRVAHSPENDDNHPVKVEIDLMETPKQISGAETLEMEKTDDTSCLGIVEGEELKDLEASAMDMEKDGHAEGNAINEKECINLDGKENRIENKQDADLLKGGQGKLTVQEVILNEREIREAEMSKNILIKDIEPLQKIENSITLPLSHGCSSITSTLAPVFSTAVSTLALPGSTIRSPSLSISLAGWPGNLPLGLFSPVAAAWPGVMPFSGTACADQSNTSDTQVSSFLYRGARHPWKRCSSHVFIAHYIDLQQQMQRHPPLWVATYGSTAAGLYGTKPYNLNNPVSNPDTVFSNGPDVMINPSGRTIVGPATGSTLPVSERLTVETANVQGLKERVSSTHCDTHAKKSHLQQSLHTGQLHQQHPLLLSLQAGPAFGFPITQGAPAISNAMSSLPGAGTSVNAMAIGSKSVAESGPTNAGVVVGSASGTTNTSAVNEATSQVQYLKAMMQHTSFPFPFPPMHFGPTFNGPPGHISQQATQLFGNPFYGTHLVHPSLHLQQNQADAAAGLISSLKQQQQHLGLQNQSSGPSQEQQQQTHPVSPPCSQVHHALGPHSHHPSDKEGSIGRESYSFAENKGPVLQRGMYNHMVPNIQVSEMNSAAVFAASTPVLSLNCQDLTLMNAPGSKQNGKLQRQQQQASRQQPPQQVPISSQQHHQQRPSAQHHTLSSALSTNIKDLEPHAYSNMFHSNLSKGSVGPGPVGLAPVAAVMAPQGHAMLQTVADLSRSHIQSSHQSLSKQPHHHILVQGQNQQSPVVQRTKLNAVDVEEVGFTGSNRMRDLPEERKTTIQRSIYPAAFLNSEISPSIHNSINSSNMGGLAHGSSSSSTSASTVASMTIFTCHQNEQSTTSVSVPITSLSQLLKPGMMKTFSNAASSPALADSSVGSLTGVIQNKLPASGFPLSGQTIANSGQSLRHGHAAHAQQGTQVKPAQRVSTISHVQAPPSSLAGSAAPRYQGQSHSRAQQIPLNMAPGSKLSPASISMPTPSLSPVSRYSPSMPLSPLLPVLKSSLAASSKPIAPMKISSTHMQKVSGTSSSKRSASVISPSSSGTAGPVGQNIKSAYPQEHQQIHHAMQQQHQHLPQVLQQSQAILIDQRSMPQLNAQHQSNPPANLLHSQMLQSPHLEMRQQLPLQQQQSYLQQHQHELNQSQSISPQSQGFIHSPQQSHGQQLQYSSSLSSQIQHQHNATVQQGHKFAQSHQGLLSSNHLPLTSFGVVATGPSLASEDLASSANNKRTLGIEAVAAGYRSMGSKSLKFAGNLVASGAQRSNNVSPSVLKAASTTVGQPSVISGTCADEASQDPTNGGACLTSVSLSSRQSQAPLPSSPRRPQACISKRAAGDSTGECVGETLSSRSETPVSTSTNLGRLPSSSCMNTDLSSVNEECIPGSSSQ